MNGELQPGACMFCGREIKLIEDQWSIQGPCGTLPGALCWKCAHSAIPPEMRIRNYRLFVGRKALKEPICST